MYSNVRALALSDGVGDAQFENTERLLKALSEEVDREMAGAVVQAEQALSGVRTIAYLIAVTVFAVALLVALFVIVALKRRIQQLAARAREIAEGSLRVHENGTVEDELSVVERAMDEIRHSFVTIVEISQEMAVGDFGRRIEARSGNDALAEAINQMAANMVEIGRQVNVIAQGDFSADIAPRSERDQLGIAMQEMTRSLRETAAVAREVASGNLDVTVREKGGNDLLGSAINQMILSVREVAGQLERISQGDFTIEVTPRSESDLLGHAMHRLNQTLRTVADIAVDMASGQFNRLIEVKGEQDRLAAAINQMSVSLQEIASQANVIATGDYSAEITPRSERDLLGVAMQRMVLNLRSAAEASSRNAWLQEGVARLNEALRGESQLQELARRVIEQLCHYLNAQVGALYVRRDLDEQGMVLEQPELVLVGSYAYSERKNLSNLFRFGESLVGQAALEGQPIRVSNVPDDYVKVVSAVGESTPHHIMVVPFLYEGLVRGVIEIATVDALNDHSRELFERSVEAIGIAFEGVSRRMALDKALKDSQTLTEELQTQQEELQETNEQLEEQTQALERTQREVEERNQRLEAAQGELNERAEQLAQSSRYKSEFLANMSHELRTPLNSILLLSRMIAAGEVADEEEQRTNAKVIHDAGSDLLGLINEVLDLAKIEAGKMTIHTDPIDVAEFASSFTPQFGPQTSERGLGYEVVVDPVLPATIHSDRERLQQVLRNFLSNALKFTEQGGVTLRAEPVTEGVINHLITFNTLRDELRSRPGDYIVFSVEDSGIGIPQEKRQLVFEAFQQADGTTSRNYGGTGLGLSISNQIADMLEGALALRSSVAAEGHGSIFSIVIPVNPSQALRAISSEAESLRRQIDSPVVTVDVTPASLGVPVDDDQATTSPDDERILLVVEDDPLFAQLLVNQGRKYHYKVVHAATGTEGVRLAEHYLPKAILLDIQLPILDGWGVLRHLKKNSLTSHIPVHVFSSLDEAQFGYRLGAAQYLTKPVTPEHLSEAFDRMEKHLAATVRKLLVVEDNQIERESIIKLLECERGVLCEGVASGSAALEALRQTRYDAFILDLKLPDMSGFELLEKMEADDQIERIPTIVYTGKELSLEEEKQLRRYAESIVLKSAESPARLLEETSIFLHRMRSTLSEEKQRMISEVIHVDEKFRGRTILLVDDDIRNTFALSAVLRRRGLEVITAADGEQALEQLDAHADLIDIVLMDIMMPVMDGYEAMRKIREQSRFERLPLIALTAKALKEDRERCIAAGASDYMTKPIDHDQLFSLIRVWITNLEQ